MPQNPERMLISSSSRERSRLLRVALSTPFLGSLMAFLAWPIVSATPSAGTDASWVAALYMALEDGLQFGTQFVFAYGPLGFLEQPVLYDGGLWVVALLYGTAVYVALAVALLWATRRAMPLPAAGAIVYALLAIGHLEAAALLLTFVLCVAGLSRIAPRWYPLALATAGGLLGAIELLAKLNYGITVIALCLIALLGMSDGKRSLPVFGGTLIGGVLLLWLLTGQEVSNLGAFATNSLQVLSGYSEAMGVNVSDVEWQRPWAVAAVILLVGAAALSGRDEPQARRIALIVLTATFGFLVFKQSFVRQGLGNAQDFFPLMLGAGLGLSWRLLDKIPRLPSHAGVVAVLAPLAVLTVVAFPGSSLSRALAPGDHAEFLGEDVRALFSPAERRELSQQGSERMRSYYEIDRETLSLVRAREVAVEPWEIGAAWAYDLRWHPLPVIQGYQAYTPELDELNAQALSGSDRPMAILRHNTAAFGDTIGASIDERSSSWDPPAAARAMLCNYRSVRATRSWQVLYPTADRCGRPRLLGRVTTRTDEAIQVPPPPPAGIVFARVKGLEVDGPEKIRTFLYRARARWATVNGETSWRIVPATLGDGLMLRADKRVDFPTPFTLAPQARTISFKLAGSEREVEVEFYAEQIMALQPASRAQPRPPQAAGHR